MKKRYTLFLVFLILSSLLAGCGQTVSQKQSQAENGQLRIVTTIFPEYDWVREILGEQMAEADVRWLLDNGVDLHSYQPTADDLVLLSDCDLFLYVGGESDAWVEEALEQTANPNRKVINLLDVLGDAAKTEELKPGMQTEEGHHHGFAHFADSDVQDRALTDWSGTWQSVYPFLQDGTLDEVMEQKAQAGEKTTEEVRQYYETGYQTDVETIVIDGEAGTITFVKNGVSAQAEYQYQGYQIYDYPSGSRGVRYFFAAVAGDEDAPAYVQFSDHGIQPGQAGHFHIYSGEDGFDALSEEMEHWPTYYPSAWIGEEIAEEMLEHEEEEWDEHVWLSLKNAQVLCEEIASALAEVDPAHEKTYQTNAETYLEKLSALDQQYQQTVAQASQKTVLFADRFPFRYLVDDYGLDYYAAFAGCSAESEASFETVSFLARQVDRLALPCVLTIEGQQHPIAETVVEATQDKNQSILTMDSMQSVTAEDAKQGVTYLSVMEQNLQVLQAALE